MECARGTTARATRGEDTQTIGWTVDGTDGDASLHMYIREDFTCSTLEAQRVEISFFTRVVIPLYTCS